MKTFLRLLSFLRPHLGNVTLSILAGVAAIAAGVGLLGTSAYLISAAALHPSIAELQVAIVGVRFFGISRAAFRYLERLVSHSVNLKVLSDLRVWFYQAIEPLAPARLQATSSGDLLQRVTGDIETLENFYVRCVSPILVALITGCLASAFVGSIFPPLSLVLAAGLALNGIALPAVVFVFSKHNARGLIQSRSEASARIVEYVQNLGVLQIYGADEHALEGLFASTGNHTKRVLVNKVLEGVTDGAALLVSNLTLLAALWIMVPAVRAGEVGGVLLAVVALVCAASFEGVMPLPLAAQQLNASLEASRRLFGLTGPEVHPALASGGIIPFNSPGVLQADHLTLSYDPDAALVLHDLNLKVCRGRKIAVVGASGAGKSSLVNLILGFWQPLSGTIQLDGVDITTLDEDWLRSQFGLISPSTAIFNASLRENLLLGKPGATDEELVEVMAKLNMSDWLHSLPQGLDTWLGEQGTRLSAGERQRIAIARVILQQPAFLLLDEPLANLDPANAADVLQALFMQNPGTGVLYITHDLLQLTGMDEILLIEKGEVTERGNYRDLITMGGRFARLAAQQADQMQFVG